MKILNTKYSIFFMITKLTLSCGDSPSRCSGLSSKSIGQNLTAMVNLSLVGRYETGLLEVNASMNQDGFGASI